MLPFFKKILAKVGENGENVTFFPFRELAKKMLRLDATSRQHLLLCTPIYFIGVLLILDHNLGRQPRARYGCELGQDSQLFCSVVIPVRMVQYICPPTCLSRHC